MSLRGRLLVAVGAVALIALLAADVATYSSLKNFLYDRVDESLETTQQGLERGINGDGPGGPRRGGPPDAEHFAPGTFVEVRDSDDEVSFSSPARFAGGDEYSPNIPDHVDLSGSKETFFTVGPVESGGPEFRVRASTLPSGGQLLV